MTNRERLRALLHYEDYDHLPVVHFGWWEELLDKWVQEGHVTRDEVTGCWDGGEKDRVLGQKLGFDFNYYTTFHSRSLLFPAFESKVIKELEDGSKHILDGGGAITLWRPNTTGIPSEIGHTLVDRESWEKHYLPKLQWDGKRINEESVIKAAKEAAVRTEPLGIQLGSLFGEIRNWMGIEGISYLLADDEDLYDEIIKVSADIQFETAKKVIAIAEKAAGVQAGQIFDFAHYWEDIAFRNGPLVAPSTFYEKVGPHYRRFSDLCNSHGIDIISLDCDGDPETLIPTWLENGVNTMFPIEVGVWDGSFGPWRKKYGKALRGVGGMNKHVLTQDHAAIDKELERLRPVVELGGYLPCPDHRLPPDTTWENTRYYCGQFRKTFA
jgi:uroporphyrinogen decarboxylase